MMVIEWYINRLNQKTSALPLVIFRVAFGFLMAFSQSRFLWKDWVNELYINPTFHFTFPGFQWVKVLPDLWMYSLVVFTIFLSLMIACGLFYRISLILFFISFTYLELIDMSLYLNHYYFISLISFLLIFLPANTLYSIDNLLGLKAKKIWVLNYQIEIIKWQLSIVYLFAGLAKIKWDWLINAQPMNIWLAARADFPVIGFLFDHEWTAYFFSWSGMIYDCTIPFFLFNKKTRPFAFLTVIFFHVMTWLLFNIGMFPWIMMASSLIFFDTDDWKNLLSIFKFKLEYEPASLSLNQNNQAMSKFAKWVIAFYFIIQLALPIRQHIYKGNPLWTELGYRFSWNVMLAEKTGYCHFNIEDKDSGKSWTLHPSDHLTNLQEKQMAFQPDMIWQFAKHLEGDLIDQGYKNLTIKAFNKVSLNGRPSQFLINPEANLLQIKSVLDLHQIILKENQK